MKTKKHATEIFFSQHEIWTSNYQEPAVPEVFVANLIISKSAALHFYYLLIKI